MENVLPKGVARIFGRGSAIWSEATDIATCFASEASRSAADFEVTLQNIITDT